MAYFVGNTMMNASAPTLTPSETSLATRCSSASVMFGRTNSPHRLRVKRFAAAMDITAAGTSAPIAMAANATPVNHDGNCWIRRSGTA